MRRIHRLVAYGRFQARVAAHLARRRLRGAPPPRRFYVLFTHRSGSNLLRQCLDRLPGVACSGEILDRKHASGLPIRWIPRWAVMWHLAHAPAVRGRPVAGACLTLQQLEWRGVGPADLATAWPEARFVVLYRRRLADQYLSLRLARVTGEWTRRAGARPSPLVHVRLDPKAFRAFVASTRTAYARTLDDLGRRGVARLVLSYERLASDPQRVLDETAAPFLGVAARPVRLTLVKQGIYSPEQVVENFDEIRDIWDDPAYLQDYGEETPVSGARAAPG